MKKDAGNGATCAECARAGYIHEEIVAQCKRSPLDALLILANYHFLNTPFHHALNKSFIDRYNAGIRRFLYLCARNHAKTTLFGIGIPLWRFCVDPNDTILGRMGSTKNTEQTLRVLTNILLTSKTVEHFFPHLVLKTGAMTDGKNWKATQSHIILPRERDLRSATYEAQSITSRVTGGRFKLHVNDDLIDEAYWRSDVTQERVIDLIKNSDSLMEDQGKDIEMILGTMWPGIFYRWCSEEYAELENCYAVTLGCYVDDRYRSFLAENGIECTQEDGEPVWPEKFTVDALEGTRKKDPIGFSCQWLNNPLSDDLMRFSPDDIMYYTLDAPRENCIIYRNELDSLKVPTARLLKVLTVDPATGEGKKTDQSALVCCGYDEKTGLAFVLDAWDGRVLPHSLISRMLDMAEFWDVDYISPEDVSFQKVLKHFVRQEMAVRGRQFAIRPSTTKGRAKGWRILDALQAFVTNHQVYFRKSQKRRLVDELVRIQVNPDTGKIVGRSPNLVDALSYQAEFWRGQHIDEPMDEIEYEDAIKPPVVRSYGLECRT